MPESMHFAFIDESGTVGSETGIHFLIVGVICSDRPREIEIPVKRAQKKIGKSLASGEMKASTLSEAVIFPLLTELVKGDIQILAVAVDQKVIRRAPDDKENIYRKAVSKAVYHLVERWPRIQICLDQRYTSDALRFELERHIREEIVDLLQKVVLIRQLNSQAQRGLQAADFIAWSFFQKYEKDDCRFVDVLSSKIVYEEVIKQKTWKKENRK